MGEVYRAGDTRLGRDVAIKILPESFARDGDRLHRFELESRTVAAVNHPNILALFDIGSQDGSPYIVSELLEGQTLRQRLDQADQNLLQRGGTAVTVESAMCLQESCRQTDKLADTHGNRCDETNQPHTGVPSQGGAARVHVCGCGGRRSGRAVASHRS